jgi:hypothetical protein
MGPGYRGGRQEGRGWPGRAIAEIAERQGTMVTTAQLRAMGISASSITRAVGRGRLHPVHRGVYSLVDLTAPPRLAGERAAPLICGESAVLTEGSHVIHLTWDDIANHPSARSR